MLEKPVNTSVTTISRKRHNKIKKMELQEKTVEIDWNI